MDDVFPLLTLGQKFYLPQGNCTKVKGRSRIFKMQDVHTTWPGTTTRYRWRVGHRFGEGPNMEQDNHHLPSYSSLILPPFLPHNAMKRAHIMDA